MDLVPKNNNLIKLKDMTPVAIVGKKNSDDDGNDDDFVINIKPRDDVESAEISSVIDKIMVNADWLWRQASNDDLESTKTEPQSTDGYIYTIVLTSAFYRNKQEKSLSLFQMNEKIRATEIKYLQVEADLFLAFLSAEKRDVKSKTAPVALIKNSLISNIQQHGVVSLFSDGITITTGEEENSCMGCHWDINLNNKNTDDTNILRLYGVLAQSSKPYRNNGANFNLANKNRQLKIGNQE